MVFEKGVGFVVLKEVQGNSAAFLVGKMDTFRLHRNRNFTQVAVVMPNRL